MITAATILFLTFVLSFMSFKSFMLRCILCLWPNKYPQVWRLFTHTFIHEDKGHLYSNVFFYCIGFFGFFQKFNEGEFLLFYFSSSLFSVIPLLFLYRSEKFYTAIGNSAVVQSIIYAFVFSDFYAKWVILGIGVPVYVVGIINLLLVLMQIKEQNVSHLSHLSGMVYGIIYSICLL